MASPAQLVPFRLTRRKFLESGRRVPAAADKFRQTFVTFGTNPAWAGLAAGARKERHMSAVAVRAMFRSHPERPAHSEAMSRCIDACFNCVETCTACADACLSERDVSRLVACIRLNLDCAAVCNATGNIMARSNKAGHRQLLEAQLANCIAFCRACADECGGHSEMHKHCAVCAEACTACAEACTLMLSTMRMPT
jgi:uncharacterized protein DUF326